MTVRRGSVALLFPFLFLAVGPGAYADHECGGSVSASYDASSKVLVVTAAVGSSQCDTTPSAEIEVEGFNFGTTQGCPSLGGCTLTWTFGSPLTDCFKPGPHNINATFSCNNYRVAGGTCFRGTNTTGSTSFNVPSSVASSSINIEQLTSTSIRLHMLYALQSASGGATLKLNHYLPTGAGEGGDIIAGTNGSSGEWTLDFNTGCWLPGTHRFVYTVTACNNDSKVTETSYAIPDEKPTIAASVTVTGPNAIRVDMPFSFPSSVSSRYLELSHTKPDGSGDGIVWIGPGNLQAGTWSQSFDTTCWPLGTHTFTALARSCNRTSTTTTATYEVVRKPHVDVAILKTGATKTAQISYQFHDNEPNGRSLSAEFLPVFPANTVTPVSLPPWSGDSGTISVDVSSFGTSGILRVQASNSCGDTDIKDTFVDCDCHADEGDKTTGHPVRLWDGSMTYSERDPLPSEAMTLFTRNYDTNDLRDGVFGVGWRSAFDAGLAHFTDGPLDTVTIQMEGERKAAFVKSGGTWTQTWPAGISPAATLTQQSDGTWLYRDGGSQLFRIFRSDGRFGGFDDRASPTKVLIDYDASGLPLRAYAADGTWSCTITATGNHITTIAVADGRIWYGSMRTRAHCFSR